MKPLRKKLALFSLIAAFFAVSASASEPTYGPCYARFDEHRHELAKQSLLVDPLGTFGTDLGGAITGATLGEFSTFDLTLFAVDFTGGLGGLVLGGTAALIAGTTFETLSIIHWVQTANTMRVIRESYAGSGKDLTKLSVRLTNQNPQMKAQLTEAEIAQEIIAWTENGTLCDGSLKTHPPRNHKLKNLLPTPRELRAALIKP